MSMRFTVLASGSAGNASFIEAGGFGLLLDIGLGPRQLAARLAAVGTSWNRVHAVLLTHTHGDHWRNRTLAHLRRRRIPLYCHAEHQPVLEAYAAEFAALKAEDLVCPYEAERELSLSAGLRCQAVALRHDAEPTFGFRLETSANLFGGALRRCPMLPTSVPGRRTWCRNWPTWTPSPWSSTTTSACKTAAVGPFT